MPLNCRFNKLQKDYWVLNKIKATKKNVRTKEKIVMKSRMKRKIK